MTDHVEIESWQPDPPSYPKEWMRNHILAEGAHIVVRPIHPEDESLYKIFIEKSSAVDIRHRFFESMRALPGDLVVQLTHIDYIKIMAFAALNDENGELLGVSRYVQEPEYNRAEFSVMTRSDWKGHGVGFILMKTLIDYAKTSNVHEIWGQVTRDNVEMVQMCRELDFQISADETDVCCVVATLKLPLKAS